MLNEYRLPFLTYQRKLFVREAKEADPALYMQIMQDIVNNRWGKEKKETEMNKNSLLFFFF